MSQYHAVSCELTDRPGHGEMKMPSLVTFKVESYKNWLHPLLHEIGSQAKEIEHNVA